MQRISDFIEECDGYTLVTCQEGKPYGRPFATLLEYEGCLFFATSTTKQVYHQLIDNPYIQIIARKKGKYDWIRISGQAALCHDAWIREELMEFSFRTRMLFASASDPTLALFRVDKAQIEYN